MVTIGITLIAITVSVVVLMMSQNVFTDTYGRSQENVFLQVENELNDLHTDLQGMVEAIDSSWAFRLYLCDELGSDNVQRFQTFYQMEEDLDSADTTDIDRLNILVVGMQDVNYLTRTETVILSNEEILESVAVQRALEGPENIHYTYSHGAYTTTSRYSDVIIASKALYFRESGEAYGVVLVTLGMDDMQRFYDYFVSENTDWYLVDDAGVVMCASDESLIGEEIQTSWYQQVRGKEDGRYAATEDGRNLTVLSQEMPYLGAVMYGVIDNQLAIEDLYNLPLLITLCAAIGLFILFVCMIFMRRTLRPLSNLVDEMASSHEKEFREHVQVEGSSEVQQLALTYNEMLDDIQNYISELMETQQAQRKAEIKSLQMQINPHYIYNTLASIKWLVYQKDTEKTTQTIDAFISLLRNTISNTDELITIEQELVNIENYVLINHTRYGDQIRVEYQVEPDCYNCLIPKLVLQPFIENAFFHAFPSGEQGTIVVRITSEESILVICIEDDGIGMEQVKIQSAIEDRKEHFSGIGIQNVQDRLAMIYGDKSGITEYVQIDSRPGKGTRIIVNIPITRAKEDTACEDEE